jgi:hypothetical protein
MKKKQIRFFESETESLQRARNTCLCVSVYVCKERAEIVSIGGLRNGKWEYENVKQNKKKHNKCV